MGIEYTAETANRLREIFEDYRTNKINRVTLWLRASMFFNYDSFCVEQQNRLDAGLPPTVVTEILIKEFEYFIQRNNEEAETREVWEWGEIFDETNRQACKWVRAFKEYYKSNVTNDLKALAQENGQGMPDILNTEEALKYWQRAKVKGFIDDDYKFIGNKYQQTYFAKVMAEKLNLINKWKPFRDLWKYKYFSQTDREIKERFGFVKRQDEIDSIFE